MTRRRTQGGASSARPGRESRAAGRIRAVGREMMGLREKRLFIMIAAGGLLLLTALAAVAWYLIAPRLTEFHPDLPGIVAVVAGVAFVAIALGLTTIAVSALTGRRIVFGSSITSAVVWILFPPVLMLATIIGLDRDAVKRSFIAVNNALVRAGNAGERPGRVLLLLPHCLQSTECPNKITGGLIENCTGCGKCVIAELVTLAQETGLSLAVATGGTLARRVIGEVRPDAIIAVACETDLTTGIQDSYPLPVYGVLNERPNGPCRDTRVDLARVREAIGVFGARR
ncbi:MAG: DUF116 domain-containing protein [Candidatus Eisenbacteria bacterium]|nr:DUF116 domain-containing protein [Candidatus Eisenbacteria bacterium]